MVSDYASGSTLIRIQAEGQAQGSFVSSLVEGQDRNELSKKEAAWLSGIMLCVTLTVIQYVLELIV